VKQGAEQAGSTQQQVTFDGPETEQQVDAIDMLSAGTAKSRRLSASRTQQGRHSIAARALPPRLILLFDLAATSS
jgi:hypothetical protein